MCNNESKIFEKGLCFPNINWLNHWKTFLHLQGKIQRKGSLKEVQKNDHEFW